MVQVALTLPHFTVITAVPGPTALTLPLPSTVTTELLLLDQLVLSVVLLGSTDAVSLVWAPTSMILLEEEREILVAGTLSGGLFSGGLVSVGLGSGGLLTVTLQVALRLPHLTVIVAVPAAFAVTFPLLTVATVVELLDQLRVLSVALLGLIVAVSFLLLPTSKLRVLDERLTEVALTGWFDCGGSGGLVRSSGEG